MRSTNNTYYLSAMAAIAIALWSCAAPAADQLSELTARKDSLKEAKAKIAKELTKLDQEILELDTNAVKHIALVTAEQFPPQRFEHFFEVQGVAETDQNAAIYAEVSSKVMEIKVREGQQVSKGQLLVRLDDQVLRNNMAEVENQLELAQIFYKKQKNLWDQEIGTEFQYLEAKNNRDALLKKLETLESQKAMYFIKAPFSGVVDEIVPKEGEMASPMGMIVRLINLSKMYLKADVSESYIGKVKKGDTVRVSFPSVNQEMKTTISRVGNYINPNNRTFKIRLDIPNSDDMLKPNLLGELHIMDFYADNAVVIPTKLIQQTPAGKEFVYTVDRTDGVDRAKKVIVTIGLSHEGHSHVLTGLDGSEMLLAKGARSVKDGELIEIAN